MIGTILFDLDGTLLDTLEDLTRAVNYTMGTLGLPLHTVEAVRQMVGDGIEKLVERALPRESAFEAERALAVFRKYYGEHTLDDTKPYDGVTEVIGALKASGFKVAIVTNKPEQEAKKLCGVFFPAVNATVGDDKIHPPKPAPDNCLRALEILGAEKSGCIYIGDGGQDLMTAAALGVPFIGVSWGFRGRAFLQQAGASLIADTPRELLQMILGGRFG